MPQMWYYILHMSTVCSNSQLVDQENDTLQNWHIIIFIKLTTLNDEIIDKDLLFILILYQVIYGLDFLIVLTANCRR